jgi:hypothetical protein
MSEQQLYILLLAIFWTGLAVMAQEKPPQRVTFSAVTLFVACMVCFVQVVRLG